jgi:hypothetical protein
MIDQPRLRTTADSIAIDSGRSVERMSCIPYAVPLLLPTKLLGVQNLSPLPAVVLWQYNHTVADYRPYIVKQLEPE